MPIIEMSVPKGAVTADQKRALHESVGRQVAEVEGATGENPLEDAAIWMFITERSGDEWSVGGEPVTADGQPRFFTRITVQHGSMNDARRAEVARRVSEQIVAALGADPGPVNNSCVIQEISPGNWSAGGMVVTYADVMRFLGLEEVVFSYTKEQLGIQDRSPAAEKEPVA